MSQNYQRKTSDIFVSEQLRNVLEIFKDKSEVARLLLSKRIKKDILVQDHVNYICVSKNDPTKVSYLTKDRIEAILSSSSDVEDCWNSSKRFACKPGGFISKIFKDISSKEVENFANLYKTFSTESNVRFEIVSGYDIAKYYNQNSYQKQTGSLGTSCMKHLYCQNYLSIYSENSMISMLVMLNSEDKLLARALLWHIGKDKIMDRIYTVRDDTCLHQMRKWATENGYIYKAYQSWSTCVTFSDGKREFEKEFSVKLDKFDFSMYPYLDTFKWLDLSKGVIHNFKPEYFDSGRPSYITLTSANGRFEDGDYFSFCEIDREFCYKNDVVEIDGMNVNISHCVFSETLDSWILAKDSFYSDELEDYIYKDESRIDKNLLNKRKVFLNIN